MLSRWAAGCRAPSSRDKVEGDGRPVELVLSLPPDNGLFPLDDIVGYLQTAVRREAVHHDGVLRRKLQYLRVYLEAAEGAHPPGLLLLVAHAHPDVGVEHIRVHRGLLG